MHRGFLWLAGFRDLQWRRRRFVIAVLGSSLVFAITLLLAGFLSSFDAEVNRTSKLIGADGFVVSGGQPGPFTGNSPLPIGAVDSVRELLGVTKANAIVSALQVTNQIYRPDVFMIGAESGGMGTPTPNKGRVARVSGEAVVDTSTRMGVGDTFKISNTDFKVVGTTSGLTVLGAHPVVFVLLTDAQNALFGGPIGVTSIAVKGAPTVVPPKLSYVTDMGARADLRRPQQNVVESITMFRLMLWIVAAAIIGSVVYLSALERIGDFAVFKAIGTGTGDLLAALIFQAVALSFAASVLAIGVARLLAPLFPTPVLFPATNAILTPVIGVVIGALASGVALRRAVTVDPALAFGGH